MARTTFEELLDAGVHFGHLKRKWNPNMAPYIFMERSGIHILDLYKTMAKLEEATSAMKQVAKSDANGELIIPVDITVLPRPNGTHAVVAGETWNFQCWFRDNNPGPTSNFTDAVSLAFR